MRKFLHLFLPICALLLLSSCTQEASMEPDPRDISPDSVAYIVSSVGSGSVVIESPELINELTDSVNGMRSELGVYDDEAHYPQANFKGIAEGEPYEGHVTFYDGSGEVLAHIVYYDSKIYRDHYYYIGQKSLLFNPDRLGCICEEKPDGVSPVTALWFECMWGAEKIWVDEALTGKTAVTSEKELIDRLNDHFIELNFRVDEPCGEDAPYRYKVRWTYTETDELLEHVEIGEDGRILRNGNWCTPLNGPIDTKLLAEIFEKPSE